MEIYHISAECVPVAKVGGLADVVGALPKYLSRLGHLARVVIPGYNTRFSSGREFEQVFEGKLSMGPLHFNYSIVKESTDILGFELYQIRIPELFDRPEIYSYDDDTERFIAFQIAFLDWLIATGAKPDIIHCHDHHTGLVPFMLLQCYKYEKIKNTPTVLTIHNAQYQGWFSFSKMHYLPEFNYVNGGYLEWDNNINPLASAIKCACKVTTVSPTYLDEMSYSANGLENLLRFERGKSVGILNGIDTEVWNPKTDKLLLKNYDIRTLKSGKMANKKSLCQEFGLDASKPLFAFIGRLVYEKGSELLPEIARRILSGFAGKANIFILGSGDSAVEERLLAMLHFYKTHYNCHIGYNEQLAHLVYSGADFLLMPSRVEPCGLNQMYALRYGTIPIVRRTGGLRDTVTDISDGGFGICHQQTTVDDVMAAVARALELYSQPEKLDNIRKTGMAINHSWDTTAAEYTELYQSLMPSAT